MRRRVTSQAAPANRGGGGRNERQPDSSCKPMAILKSRGVLDTTLRHELVHTLIDKLSHGRAPRWLAEGMASISPVRGQWCHATGQ